MRVTMIGAGYVGLVSGACFADFGHHVTCVDKDAGRVAALKRGEIPIFEPGLADLVATNMAQERLSFSTRPDGIDEADAVFIAVGTPSRRGDGHADLSYIYSAVREIAPLLSPTAVVVTKSTVPVGTGDEIERILRDVRPEADMHVVSNPEFLREGAAIYDFKHPDRIVIGSDDERGARGDGRSLPAAISERRADALCQPPHRGADQIRRQRLPRHQDHLHQRDRRFVRAHRRRRARRGARHGPRQPHRRQVPARGPGFGGSCFPKDATALLKTAHDHGVPLRIVETVAAVNDQRKRAMARKVVTALDGSIRGKTIAVLGLSFKPNTDDMRNSPSIPLITALHDLGAIVRGYDPAAMEAAKAQLPDVIYCGNAYEAAEGAEAVVIATEWEQFRALDLDRLRSVMARPVIVDLRNIYRAEEMKRANFRYLAVGRPTAERQLESPLPRRRKAAATNGKQVGGKVSELAV